MIELKLEIPKSNLGRSIHFLRRVFIKELKINQEIKADQVVLIDENGKSQGVTSRDQALLLAYEAGLDLALVNENSHPPVSKIMDYGKYRYSQEKQESKQKSKSKGPTVKEVRLSLKISAHDLDFKTRQAQKFLDEGDRVKVAVKLIGREMMFRNKAYEMIENFRKNIDAAFESPVERLGNQFAAVLIRK